MKGKNIKVIISNLKKKVFPIKKSKQMTNFDKIMQNNKQWSDKKFNEDQNYFKRNAQSQSPKYLWIGCSDSRIPAETILGLQPGEIFVHRNVANQVSLSDINTMSVIQYAVQVLKVQDIIVTGHYGCGGIKAAFQKHDFGPLEGWLSHIRNTRIDFRHLLNNSDEQNENLLCQLNVKAQVYDIAKIACVQKAWVNGQKLRVHGLVYRLDNGILKDLGLTLDRLEQIPEEYWIYESKKQAETLPIVEKQFQAKSDRIPSFKTFKEGVQTQIKSGEKSKHLWGIAPLLLVAGAALFYSYKNK